MNATTIDIEVAYAMPGKQILLELSVPVGATISRVLEICTSDALLPDDALQNLDVGVFGRVVATSYVLRAGDRVEFYRPLTADPKEARRRRASKSSPPRGRRAGDKT